MSLDLKEEVFFQIDRLRCHVYSLDHLVQEVKSRIPTQTELLALAAYLHAFYLGIENVLERIAVILDKPSGKAHQWHSNLLRTMSEPTDQRKAVLSESLFRKLRDYLGFRHVFRHAYSFELRWSKMAPLVFDCTCVFEEFESEIRAFIEKPGSLPTT